MLVNWQVHVAVVLGLFAVGAVVGSFLNVCIYRAPWEKSLVWPASHCPRCLRPIAAQDNVPIVSWFALRGECRNCGLPIAARYPLIEALVGLLFVAVYLGMVAERGDLFVGPMKPAVVVGLAYRLVFVALLVTATFIDYDWTQIPDGLTVPGMIVGVAVGTMFPEIRPEPSAGATPWQGFQAGMVGLVVGAGLTQTVRTLGSLALRRDAMGLGDVTLMAMVGSFLGWQAAALTFFLGPFFGLGHAAWKIVVILTKKLRRLPSAGVDHEMPFGPYLSMAALTMMLSWPALWRAWAKTFFETLRMVFSFW